MRRCEFSGDVSSVGGMIPVDGRTVAAGLSGSSEPSWIWGRLWSHRDTEPVAAPRAFDEETRARAVRMYQDRIRDLAESKLTARRQVGAMPHINPETLRNWIDRQEIDSGARPGLTTEAADELKRCAARTPSFVGPAILKTASADFAQAELARRLR